jgi:hypothetical protein
MNIEDYNVVYIVYPPGWGGNHFANMLSTSPKFANRIPALSDNKYLEYLKEYYLGNINNAHINSEIQNVGIFSLDKLQKYIQLSNRKVILAGHLDETYFSFNEVKKFNKFLFIVFSLLGAEQIKVRSNKSFDGLTLFSYNETVIKKIFSEDGLTIDTCCLNVIDFLKEDASKLYQHFNDLLKLDIDVNLCNELHKEWFNKIK